MGGCESAMNKPKGAYRSPLPTQPTPPSRADWLLEDEFEPPRRKGILKKDVPDSPIGEMSSGAPKRNVPNPLALDRGALEATRNKNMENEYHRPKVPRVRINEDTTEPRRNESRGRRSRRKVTPRYNTRGGGPPATPGPGHHSDKYLDGDAWVDARAYERR